MRNIAKHQWTHFLVVVLFLSATVSSAFFQHQAEVPIMRFPSTSPSVAEKPGMIKGWNTLGWYPYGLYEYGISDEAFYNDQKSAFIRSVSGGPAKPVVYGQLSQVFTARQYRDKRMRFSAVVKSNGPHMTSALTMAVEGPGHQWISYDDMRGRNITGTKDWERYKVVLDIPEESEFITFGIKAYGKGEVWISAITFDETVEDPTAGPMYPSQPINLDFSSEAN
jgi:hypothetical protein